MLSFGLIKPLQRTFVQSSSAAELEGPLVQPPLASPWQRPAGAAPTSTIDAQPNVGPGRGAPSVRNEQYPWPWPLFYLQVAAAV